MSKQDGSTQAVPKTSKRVAAEIPQPLRNFDQLPNAAYVRQPVVAALFACSPSTIWRRVKVGTLPKPVKLTPRTTGWNVGQLRKALATAN